jgi:hypothetical protein
MIRPELYLIRFAQKAEHLGRQRAYLGNQPTFVGTLHRDVREEQIDDVQPARLFSPIDSTFFYEKINGRGSPGSSRSGSASADREIAMSFSPSSIESVT